jgi:cytoskeletal protein RodZ
MSLETDASPPTSPTAEALDVLPETKTEPGTELRELPQESAGRLVADARAARGWSVQELASRTYLTRRVITGIENDDFAASGGDCYARGHLRILAQVLNIDEPALNASFDPLGDFETPPVEAPSPASDGGRRLPVTAGLLTILLLLLVLIVIVR